MGYPFRDQFARFFNKVNRNGPVPLNNKQIGNCWLWTGYVNRGGYGMVWCNSILRNRVAHRHSYRMFVGEIEDGMEIDHICKVRNCVRPSHLEQVTPQENLRRSDGFSSINRRKTECPSGHKYSGTNIQGRRICRTCNIRATREWRIRNKVH